MHPFKTSKPHEVALVNGIKTIHDLMSSHETFGQCQEKNIARRNLLSKICCIQLSFPVLFSLESEIIVYVMIHHYFASLWKSLWNTSSPANKSNAGSCNFFHYSIRCFLSIQDWQHVQQSTILYQPLHNPAQTTNH
jgi:hypothetical protein